mgnify:CR=1 FL=1
MWLPSTASAWNSGTSSNIRSPSLQYHRDDVENEFIQAAGLQRLADGACPTCDFDWTVVGMLGRFGRGSVEAVDEVEGRPTFHVDRARAGDESARTRERGMAAQDPTSRANRSRPTCREPGRTCCGP